MKNEVDQRFQIMADHAPVLLWMAREDSLCTFFNATWIEFRGKTQEEEWGVGWAEGIHPEDFQACMDHYIMSFNQRKAFEMTYRLQRADGNYRWILDRGAPFERDGKFAGFIGSCIDITEQKQASEALTNLAERLKASNIELEHFAYLASHDLQAPLRSISSFSSLIMEKLDLSDKPEVKEYFDMMIRGSREMKELIEALLTYSRVTKEPDHARELVELNTIVQNVAKRELAGTEGNLELICDELPTLVGDRILFERLFANLLTNAYKFRKTGEKAKVRVSAAQKGTDWEISVSDNGIGMDPSHANKIFRLFVRLHSQPGVEGKGIGLAIAKKIVELHEGKISVESKPNQGARFYFTLPGGKKR